MLEFAYQRSSRRRVTNAALLCVTVALSGCMDGNSAGRDSSSAPAQTYALDTTISGLNSSGLVLMVHARERDGTDFFRMVDEPSVPARFQMVDAAAVSVAAGKTTLGLVSALPSGASYSVTIQAQPEGETCSVVDATGTIQSANAANVVVTCADQAYSLSGSIRGLNGSGLVLANGADTLAVNAGAANFTMPSPVTYTSSYLVSVQAQPPGLTCAVGNAMGTMQASAVTNIAITCTDQPFSVGGTISGLGNKAGLTLTNGIDTLSIPADSTGFTMPTTVAFGSPYSVAVQTAPAGLVCSVSNGTGTMGAADITGVSIACMSNFSLLHTFSGGSGDAADPYHTLIQDSDGDFYGTTLAGGAGNVGTIFRITPSGSESVFYSFAGTPYSGLVQSSDGNIYGTTANGGGSGRGTVFKITPSGTESVLYSFPAGSSDPYTGLIQGSDGNFYGTTGAGGANDDGTVFKITPGGTETILHTFAKTGSDGETPYAGLIQGSDGNFYGTTYFGGANGFGTVFKVTPGGTETVLYSFAGGSNDGAYPEAGLTQGSDGNFYGNTLQGGAGGFGTVFKITPTGTETVLHTFTGAVDGANPSANLVLGTDGNLYGTTGAGGAGGFGTFFKVALQP